MSEKRQIRLIINSDLKDVYLIDMLIETLCSLVHLPDDKSFWIKFCAVEAVNNSIIHAYAKESGHEVEVKFALSPESIEIEVKDTGAAMPSEILETCEMPDEDHTENRGLAIIKEIMDEVEYRSEEGLNILKMRKSLI